jgi:hypothetical protein
VTNVADCSYCSGEYMTKRGCSTKCPLRKQQIERLAEYEDIGLNPTSILNLIHSRGCLWCKSEYTIIDDDFGQPIHPNMIKFCWSCGKKLGGEK